MSDHVDFTPEQQEAEGYASLAKSGWTSCLKCGAVKPRDGWKTKCKGQVRIALREAAVRRFLYWGCEVHPGVRIPTGSKCGECSRAAGGDEALASEALGFVIALAALSQNESAHWSARSARDAARKLLRKYGRLP